MSSFKVWIQNSDSSIREIRRFETQSRYSYHMVCEKLKTLVPDLRTKNFTISWKEMIGGDLIVISSEEEYQIAEKEYRDMMRCELWVKISENQGNQSTKTEKVIHHGVCCDNCEEGVIGHRYKCIQCKNYDLCSQCEALGAHSEHYMIRMPQPLNMHHKHKFFHHLNKLWKRSESHANKTCPPDGHPFQGIHCTLQPWLEAFAPYMNGFLDVVVDIPTPDADIPNATRKESKKEESKKENENVGENAAKKFPEEGRKLLDDAKNDKGSMSDAASTSSQDSATAKVMAADEWTIVDKNDTAEPVQVSSTSPSVKDANAKRNASSSTTASAPQETSTQTLYPELPQEKVVHHPNPIINEAVETMLKMGFSNQGGLLTYLLAAEDGDINKVLEILQPANK